MADQVKWRTVGIALGVAAVVATGGGWAANAAGLFDRPAPEPTAVVEEQPTRTPTVSVTPTPTPTPTPAPVVEAPAPVVEEPVEEAPSGPDLCPEGTMANSSDGYNDTSCMPLECLDAQPLPNPAYPQCDYFYPPYYYR